jgi:hypothetical protein
MQSDSANASPPKRPCADAAAQSAQPATRSSPRKRGGAPTSATPNVATRANQKDVNNASSSQTTNEKNKGVQKANSTQKSSATPKVSSMDTSLDDDNVALIDLLPRNNASWRIVVKEEEDNKPDADDTEAETATEPLTIIRDTQEELAGDVVQSAVAGGKSAGPGGSVSGKTCAGQPRASGSGSLISTHGNASSDDLVTRIKNIEWIALGRYRIKPWYFSPYPEVRIPFSCTCTFTVHSLNFP